ncbi:putative F-box domain-containing protein [Medicago truncatula]|uniref:F-box protein interaction domain protein n=1 Tax=Medicago truncatula TaxID=3880 RepID=G7JFI0_MEDTR|nr:F-box/kelch-repeat protein At3g06240 [Medicago truncatula]AES92463.1 F-box protein interaction domain protein [Medicago truncatula]RHN64853.1 putative F-box domain-containing protein [Medicago truncatula]
MESSAYIPDDISFSILSKLPLKSFKRFECVRRSWSLLFQTQQFIRTFLFNSHRFSYYNGSSLLLRDFEFGKNDFYSIFGERFQNKVKLDFPNPFANHCDFVILGFGSVNGIICLHEDDYYGKTVLWNPSTNTIKLIPPTPNEFIESSISNSNVEDFVRIIDTYYNHGFGYDELINDYKLICYVCIDVEYADHGVMSLDSFWEIYSLRTNSWRILDVDMPYSLSIPYSEGSKVYMDGVCHWLCEVHEDNLHGPCLVSFYLSNEMFFITPISSNLDDCFDVQALWITLAVLNGCIALISYHEESTNFHISILGEFGVIESWTKLFIVGPLSYVEHPIGVGTKGEIFFVRKDKEVALFDLCSQMIEELGHKVMFPQCHRIIIYKESISPIGGISC